MELVDSMMEFTVKSVVHRLHRAETPVWLRARLGMLPIVLEPIRQAFIFDKRFEKRWRLDFA
jgi:hypothetical protein